MIHRALSFWSNRDPGDAAGRIDRALNDRNHRLSAGLSISPGFTSVQGALVVSQGNGKYLRVRHVVGSSEPIPAAISDGCLAFVQGQSSDIGELGQLLADLAIVQATVVENLKRQAGKYVDRVLAVSVCDPGLWQSDFDGRICYSPMCDSSRLAELCGVSVIDAFPARDLAVNGDGKSLESLPIWILFSDRNPKVASQLRGLISFGERTTGYSIPASDGLDSDVPEIGRSQTIGFRFLEQIANSESSTRDTEAESNQMGRSNPDLKREWGHALHDFLSVNGQTRNTPLDRVDRLSQQEHHALSMELAKIGESFLGDERSGFAQVVATTIEWVTELAFGELTGAGNLEFDHLIIACPSSFETMALQHLGVLSPGTHLSTSQQLGVRHREIESVVAAVLGLFHIDQMPANVPWLTGADSQRILGRLTPGRPSSWRQLVRAMADFHPAPMKLRDAI